MIEPAPIQTPFNQGSSMDPKTGNDQGLVTYPWVQWLNGLVVAVNNGGGGGGGGTSSVYPIEITADTVITYASPTSAGMILFVDIEQDATGGWNVTWDTMFRGGPTELGVTLPNTRYLIGFTGIDIGGTLTWVKFSEQLAY